MTTDQNLRVLILIKKFNQPTNIALVDFEVMADVGLVGLVWSIGLFWLQSHYRGVCADHRLHQLKIKFMLHHDTPTHRHHTPLVG